MVSNNFRSKPDFTIPSHVNHFLKAVIGREEKDHLFQTQYVLTTS